GIGKDEALKVGNNYDTDILAGVNAGMPTLLVHTGVTTVEKLTEYEVQTTQVVHNLTEWIEKM
ncbi:HAD hydrolase-like protein, partial [Bacillus cereus]|uniref:HAD hydrolase-like protein n=1 Tax=Bacillus cereus TaxID=1396 RepID=UPI00284BF366